ncbi:hypothetical protein XVE_4384, partial [Xanthomonas vesicatoria ATCC 35937]
MVVSWSVLGGGGQQRSGGAVGVGLFGQCDRFACQLVGAEQAACTSGGQLAQLLGFAAQARCMHPTSALMAAVIGDQGAHVVGGGHAA